MSATHALRAIRVDRRALARVVEPGALVLLLAVLPLEAVLVIATQVLIPPYIVVLPLLGIVALLSMRSMRELFPGRALTAAVVAWIAVTTISLGMWVLRRPPAVGLASGYGSVRSSVLRGPIQLAITCAFLAALPIVLVLARRRLTFAVAFFIGVAAVVASYGVYQVVANRLGLPFQNISNDPLVAGRAIPGWRGLLRPYSTFGEPSPFAAYLLGPLCLAVTLAVWPPSRRARNLAAAAAAVMFSAFVLTLSTGAWLAVPVASLVVFGAIVQRRAWWMIPAIPAAAVVVSVATLAPLLALNAHNSATSTSPPASSQPAPTPGAPVPPARRAPKPASSALTGVKSVPTTIIHRIEDSISTGRNGPRLEIEKYQVHLWKQYPVLGVGIGAADLYTAHELRQTSLPSTYGVWFGVLSETGTLGMLALLVVVGVFVVSSVRALRATPRSPWYPVVAGALAGVLGQLAAYVWFYERIPAHVWLLMGLGILASWRSRSEFGA